MTPGYSVRISTPGDDRQVTALLEASYPVLMAGSYDADLLASALPMMTRAMPALLASGTYYLAETGNAQIVGCGGWTRERPGGGEIQPGLAHIRHFATHPEWGRRGIGSAIFDRCEAAARSAGVRRFECYSSLNAIRFYEALGFQAIRQVDVPMGDDLKLPAMLMGRTI